LRGGHDSQLRGAERKQQKQVWEKAHEGSVLNRFGRSKRVLCLPIRLSSLLTFKSTYVQPDIPEEIDSLYWAERRTL
jgi:hypothetical protein